MKYLKVINLLCQSNRVKEMVQVHLIGVIEKKLTDLYDVLTPFIDDEKCVDMVPESKSINGTTPSMAPFIFFF